MMNLHSLRARVTAFYAGMLALSLVFFSLAVYGGVRAYLTRSLERGLDKTAHGIVGDFLVPLADKGPQWFLNEMGESYPAASDPFVRVSTDGQVLYESGDLRDPLVRVSALPLPAASSSGGAFRRLSAPTGQPLTVYTTRYTTREGKVFFVEAGASLDPLLRVLHSLLTILLIATPAILLIAAVGGYLLMAAPLRPIVSLTERAELVGRNQMGERLPVIPSGDELERLSLALNRMIDRLEEALAHNQRFSADASHELRTPLTIIRGELEALHIGRLPPQAVEGIASALEESDRMSRIVHSLMTITRLDGGGERMEMLPVDLTDLLTTTLEHMELLAEEKRIDLRCEAPPGIHVLGDAMRLKQVVVNLVDNAIRYTPARGTVSVGLQAVDERAVLTVSDTGIGIPAECLPFVFDRFYRADRARSRESGGTGLGLAIVKAICGAHGGTLSIESVEGQSTTVRMELPLLPRETAKAQQLKAALQTNR